MCDYKCDYNLRDVVCFDCLIYLAALPCLMLAKLLLSFFHGDLLKLNAGNLLLESGIYHLLNSSLLSLKFEHAFVQRSRPDMSPIYLFVELFQREEMSTDSGVQ